MSDIPSGISRQIPEAVLRRLDSLDQLTQKAFLTEFQKNRKSGFVTFLLWCVFPAWHYF